MVKRWTYLLLVTMLSLAVVSGVAGCSTAASSEIDSNSSSAANEESARSDYFVTVPDVAAKAGSYFLIDARAPEAYKAGHLPGAINAPWPTFAKMDLKPGDRGFGMLLPASEIGAKLGELGVDTSKTIVVYTDPTGWGEDGRVMWTLLSVGITNVRMMDGGIVAWNAAGNETSAEAVTLPATQVTVASELDAGLNVTTDYVSRNLSSLKIVDSRSAKEYDGATDYGEKRGGHIPGAVNLPYPDVFNDDGTVKSDSALRELFAGASVTKDAESVFYCTKGIRSAHMMLLARMLGFDKARNYDGSYYEWAGDAALEVEK